MPACPFGYPTLTDAELAAANVFQMLTGAQPRDIPCLIHCSWVVTGYGLSLGLPDSPVCMAAADPEAAITAALTPAFDAKGDAGGLSLNWKQLAVLALQLVLKLLS